MYYCVFWIPCVFQADLVKRDSAPHEILARIDDQVLTPIAQNIAITFPNQGRYDILLTPQDSGVAPLSLHECQTARNGLIKYCFETRGVSEQDLDFWEKALKRPIYHAFKTFFHEHVFHAPDSDALLSAYLTRQNIDIFAPNNKALCHYLNGFEQSFMGFSNAILERRNHAVAVLSQEKGVFSFIWDKYPEIEDWCNAALGKVLYYNILLKSWVPSQLKNAGEQERAKGQNAIRTIEHLREENHKAYVRLTNEMSFEKMKVSIDLASQAKDLIQETKDNTQRLEDATMASKRQGTISIIISIVSLFIGFVSLYIAVCGK